jgi:hypothetical protein
MNEAIAMKIVLNPVRRLLVLAIPLLGIGLVTLSGCNSAAEDELSVAEVQALAKEAYIYAYAPVCMERQRRNMVSVDADRGDGSAPENSFGHVRALGSPELKTIVMPNNDTLYSSAWIDLSKGPFLLEVPPMGERYFTFQMMDAFSNTFDYAGTRATGPQGGRFLLAAPGWAGEKPQDVAKVFVAPTNRIWIAARFGVGGETDLPGAHKAQDSIRLTDLNGKPVPGVNPGFTPLGAPETWSTDQFFTVFGDLLKETTTPQAAQPLIARLSAIGLSPKTGYTPASLTPETRAAIDAGAKEGFAAIEAAKLGDSANGWDFSMKNGRFGEDYLVRSAVAYRSLAGNAPEEAIYFNADKDVSGQPLDGAHRYTMRFEKGQLPPVNGFWSLTMYDGKTFFMVENPKKRYSIGSRTPGLQFAPDGSLTLYIQHADPGPERVANWLPAPAGSFDVHLRTYVPQEALLDGSYKLPPIVRTNPASD